MAEIIKVFRDPAPALRFIGRKYDGFGHWGEWFQSGWFDQIEAVMGGTAAITEIWPNGGGYVGIECRREGKLEAYWLGMFTPADTPVPEGFAYMDFPAGGFGTLWIYGTEKDVHKCGGRLEALRAAGMEPTVCGDGTVMSFENCLCPRYTTPDEKGNVILDYCYFVK